MSSLFPKGSAFHQEEERRRRFDELPPDVARNTYTADRPSGLHSRDLRRESRNEVTASRDDLDFVENRLENLEDTLNELTAEPRWTRNASKMLIDVREAREVLRQYQ